MRPFLDLPREANLGVQNSSQTHGRMNGPSLMGNDDMYSIACTPYVADCLEGLAFCPEHGFLGQHTNTPYSIT